MVLLLQNEVRSTPGKNCSSLERRIVTIPRKTSICLLYTSYYCVCLLGLHSRRMVLLLYVLRLQSPVPKPFTEALGPVCANGCFAYPANDLGWSQPSQVGNLKSQSVYKVRSTVTVYGQSTVIVQPVNVCVRSMYGVQVYTRIQTAGNGGKKGWPGPAYTPHRK